MLESGFIPQAYHDLITLFTAFVAFLTFLQLLQVRRILSTAFNTAKKPNLPEYWPIALMMVALACFFVAIIMGIVHVFVSKFDPTAASKVAIGTGTITSVCIGLPIGELARDVAEDRVQPSIHTVVIGTALFTTYILAITAWPESHFFWFLEPKEAMKAGVIVVPGIVAYCCTSKPWEAFSNDSKN